MSRPTVYRSRAQASTWSDGLVVGAGRIGAVLHGGPSAHAIDITHEEFFLPVGSRTPAPALSGVIEAAATAALAGDGARAATVISDAARAEGFAGDVLWPDPFVPLCTIVWAPLVEDATDYERRIDLATGAVSAQWRSPAAGTQSITVTPDLAAGTLVVDLVAELGGAGSLRVRPNETATGHVGQDGVRHLARTVIATRDGSVEAAVTATTPSVDRTGRAVTTSPLFRAAEGEQVRVTLYPGVPERLTISAGVSPAQPPAPAPLRPQSPPSSWDAARFSLDAAGAYETTEILLAAARDGDPAATAAAHVLAFDAGRRHVIASTGTLPPKLSGVWQGTWAPAWSSAYVVNGNLQHGALAAAAWTGAPGLLLSAFRLLDRHREDLRENAARLFAAPGLFVPAHIGTHAKANHFNDDYPHLFWLGGGAWFTRLAYDYAAVTGDVAFVRDWAYPFAVEAMTFAEQVLREGADGRRHVAPSFSPENTPAGASTPIAADATADVAAMRDGALAAARLAVLAGRQGDAERWLSLRDAMPPYRVADGAFAEWSHDAYADVQEHRHANHLHGFGLEGDERLDDPELRRAAEVSIERRLAWREAEPTAPPGRMEMAFGLVQLGSAAATLGRADLAERCLDWLAREHVQPNTMTTHDARRLFNVDAAGGHPALVAAVLVASTPDTLTLLPALPAAWVTGGSAAGLTARGGVRVTELHWAAGHATALIERVPGSAAVWPVDGTRLIAGPGWTFDGDAPVLGSAPIRVRLVRA